LMTSRTEKVASGEFPMNHWALVRDQNYVDIGADVDVAIVSWRPKALDMSGESIITCYDHKDAVFIRIQEKAGLKDSKCMSGAEFLVWVPSKKCFATLFMGTKSARREAPTIKSRMGKAATLKSKKIETKSYKWYAPLCVACSTPFELPPQELVVEVLTKFNNPPQNEVESAPEETRER